MWSESRRSCREEYALRRIKLIFWIFPKSIIIVINRNALMHLHTPTLQVVVIDDGPLKTVLAISVPWRPLATSPSSTLTHPPPFHPLLACFPFLPLATGFLWKGEDFKTPDFMQLCHMRHTEQNASLRSGNNAVMQTCLHLLWYLSRKWPIS